MKQKIEHPGVEDSLEESVTNQATDRWMGGRTEPLMNLPSRHQGVEVVGKDEKKMASTKRDLSSRTGENE